MGMDNKSLSLKYLFVVTVFASYFALSFAPTCKCLDEGVEDVRKELLQNIEQITRVDKKLDNNIASLIELVKNSYSCIRLKRWQVLHFHLIPQLKSARDGVVKSKLKFDKEVFFNCITLFLTVFNFYIDSLVYEAERLSLICKKDCFVKRFASGKFGVDGEVSKKNIANLLISYGHAQKFSEFSDYVGVAPNLDSSVFLYDLVLTCLDGEVVHVPREVLKKHNFLIGPVKE